MSLFVWSKFPNEGWRSLSVGSMTSSHPRTDRRPEINAASRTIRRGVAKARDQSSRMSREKKIFTIASGVFERRGSGCVCLPRLTAAINGHVSRLLGW